jgi:hypothetical protein
MFRSTAADETDWLAGVEETEHTAVAIAAAAHAEADAWMRTKTAAPVDAAELRVQAEGYANIWAGQYGVRSGIAAQAFMDRFTRVTGATRELDDGARIDIGGDPGFDDPGDGDISVGFGNATQRDEGWEAWVDDSDVSWNSQEAADAFMPRHKEGRQVTAEDVDDTYGDYFEEDRAARIRYENIEGDEDTTRTAAMDDFDSLYVGSIRSFAGHVRKTKEMGLLGSGGADVYAEWLEKLADALEAAAAEGISVGNYAAACMETLNSTGGTADRPASIAAASKLMWNHIQFTPDWLKKHLGQTINPRVEGSRNMERVAYGPNWDTGELMLWIENDYGLYTLFVEDADGMYDGGLSGDDVEHYFESVGYPQYLKVDPEQVEWNWVAETLNEARQDIANHSSGRYYMSSKTAAGPKCIADDAAGIPLWECPCRECTKMDWEATPDDGKSLSQYRKENWPEHYATRKAAVALDPDEVPEDFPVVPYASRDDMPDDAKDPAMCGSCELWWDDGISTQWTPAPSARCPFEYYHVYDDGYTAARKQAYGNPADARAADADDQVDPEFMPAQVDDMVPTTGPFNAGEWTVEGMLARTAGRYLVVADETDSVVAEGNTLAEAVQQAAELGYTEGYVTNQDGGRGDLAELIGKYASKTAQMTSDEFQALIDRAKAERDAPAAAIDDSTSSYTLSPDTPNWIGNFTDRALAEMREFWSSGSPESLQNPGQADEILRHLEDEAGRRAFASKTAEYYDDLGPHFTENSFPQSETADIAEWGTKGGKYTLFLTKDKWGYNYDVYDRQYSAPRSSGSFEAESDEAAIQEIEDRIHVKRWLDPKLVRKAQVERKTATDGKNRIFRVLDARGRETVEGIAAYLPRNYNAYNSGGDIYISGYDQAGWTGEYVVERLASGLHFVEELTQQIAADALTPVENRTWASKTASAGFKVIEHPDADQFQPYLPYSVVDDVGTIMSRRPDLESAQRDVEELTFLHQFTNGTPKSKYIPRPAHMARKTSALDDYRQTTSRNFDKVYKQYAIDAGRFVNHWSGPSVDRERVQVYDSTDGIGRVVETIYMDEYDGDVEELILDRIGVSAARKNVTRRDAEKVLAAVKAQLGYGSEGISDEEWHSAYGAGPQIMENWDFMGYGNPAPFSIVWEEGPYEWAIGFPYGGVDPEFGLRRKSVEDLVPDHVWTESTTSWAIGIYSKAATFGSKTAAGPSEDHQSGDGESSLADVEVGSAPENFDQMWLDGNPAGRKVEQDNPEDTKADGPKAPSGQGRKPAGAAPQVDVAGHDDTAMFESGEIEGDWDEENKATNPNTTKAASVATGDEYDLFES